MADLGMTEAEIFAASFASRHIVRGIRRDRATGFAAEVLFQYRETSESAQPDLVVYQEGLRDLDKSSEFAREGSGRYGKSDRAELRQGHGRDACRAIDAHT